MHVGVVGVRRTEALHHVEEAPQAGALQVQGLAAEQVQRLDLRRAFVDGGDARIARELFHAPFAHVAVAAEALQGVVGTLVRPFGQHALHDRRQEAEHLVGGLALFGIGRSLEDVHLQRRMQRQQAAAFDQRFAGQQHAADIGMHDQRIGGLVREFRPGQRAHLQTVARIGQRVLEGTVADGQSLDADGEAGGVHHGEHRVQALVRLRDQIALRGIEIHHASGRAVDSHLVFDRTAAHRIALADAAVARDLELGHDEERNAFRAGRRIGQACEH